MNDLPADSKKKRLVEDVVDLGDDVTLGYEQLAEETIEPVGYSATPTVPFTRSQLELSGKIGHYTILDEIGAGGMGKVYKALDNKLDRIVAIKVMLRSGEISAKARNRFLAEARLTAKLKHPNIVAVHEINSEEGIDYIAMDFIDGKSLATLLDEKKFTPRESLELMRDIAFAMDYAHKQGIVHRDLKPGNLLVDNNGSPLVMDFGLAKNVEISAEITKSGEVLGTPKYMPPEQASGKLKEISPVSDVYALGAILYEMLTGTQAIEGDTPVNIIYNIIYNEIVPPRKRNPRLAMELETICLKALAKEPARRYASSREFAADIERFLNGEMITARRSSLWYRSWKKIQQNKLVVAACAVLVLLFCIYEIHRNVKLQKAIRRQQATVKTSVENIGATTQKICAKTKMFLQGIPDEGFFKERYPRLLYERVSAEEREYRNEIVRKSKVHQEALQNLVQALTAEKVRLETNAVLDVQGTIGDQIEQLQKTICNNLYNLYNKIAILALEGNEYILSRTYLEFRDQLTNGKSIATEKIVTKETINDRQQQIKDAQKQRIREIMSMLKKDLQEAKKQKAVSVVLSKSEKAKSVDFLMDNLIDFMRREWIGQEYYRLEYDIVMYRYISKILQLRSKQIVEYLVPYLWNDATKPDDPELAKWQRLITIEALGQLGYKNLLITRVIHKKYRRRSKKQKLDIVQWLIWRLRALKIGENAQIEQKQELKEARLLIWTLGRLRDPRANGPVFDVRKRVGMFGSFWLQTQIPFQWIPLEYLFEIDLTQQKALDQSRISPKLKALFADNQNHLSSPKLRVINPGQKWLLQTKKQTYSIKRKDNVLRVYKQPQTAEQWLRLGMMQTAKGNNEAGLNSINHAIKLKPDLAQAYNFRGMIYHYQQQPTAAIRNYSKALQLQPQMLDAYINRGHTYYHHLGDVEAAIADYAKVISMNPRCAAAYAFRALAYVKQGKRDKALWDMVRRNKIIEGKPIKRGDIALWTLKKTSKFMQRPLKTKGKKLLLHCRKGFAAYHHQKWQQATKDFTKAIALAYRQRAQIYQRQKLYRRAVGDWKRYLQLAPNVPDAAKIKACIRKYSK